MSRFSGLILRPGAHRMASSSSAAIFTTGMARNPWLRRFNSKRGVRRCRFHRTANQCAVSMRMKQSGCAPIPIVTSIAALSAGRKAWLCDVWGVLHDGTTAFGSAITACREFRRGGGEIVLISNSPRPSPDVVDHLRTLGVTQDSFDAIVTSGDVTQTLVNAYDGQPVFHIGPERDKSFYKGLSVQFASPANAKVCVCTGFYDEDHDV